MQQYLTLEEAAKYLQMPPDELREMAKKKAVRAFQDRGTWRFRSQDVEELARLRGLGSDAQLQLGEAARKTPQPKKVSDAEPLPADFTLEDDEVPIGREKLGGSGPRSSKSGPRSPKPGSDSDVRLVMDSNVAPGDSEVKFDQPAGSKPGSSKRKLPGTDSGVRLVPPEHPTDSDVKLDPSGKDSGARKSKSPSDSDIRLQEATPKKKGPDASHITEEIDLDAEAARHAEKQKKTVKGKPTQVANAGLPTQSPFELSEPDLELEAKKKGEKPAGKKKDSSSDFELIAFDSTKSPVELGSGEIPLLHGDEEVALGSEVRSPKTGNSGINLQDPADSGISLEEGGSDDMIEFELKPDVESPSAKPTAKGGKKPAEKPAAKPAAKKPEPKKPEPKKKAEKKTEKEDSSDEFELSVDDDSSKTDSSSEFELSLDADSSSETDSSSEFELSLEEADDKGKSDESSDSEFELTLDDEGGLAVEEEAGDIFEETNFDVPPIDESGSEAVPIDEDTDLEGSDFEISLDDDSTASGERAGKKESQVVNLEDEEEADDAAATVAKPRKTASKSKAAAAAAAASLRGSTASDEDLEVDLDELQGRKRAAVDEEEESEEGIPAAAAPAAEWGPLPAILLFPTVIVLFLVGIMGFELLRGMWGFHRPAPVGKPVVDAIARQFDLMPK
jgi:excisionase family DNA binding protein